jgi:diaminopropionate ammonia-lyase
VNQLLRRPQPSPGEPPTRAPLEFHRRLPGYEPSPLHAADGLSRRLGLGAVWVKDESSRLGLPSFKILGASWGIYRALEQRFGAFRRWGTFDDLTAQLRSLPPLTLVAATDGNHGRAVAHIARLLGLGARIFVPAGTATARIEAIESDGAACEIVGGTYDDAVARSAEEAGEHCLVISDTSWPGYSDVPRWIIEGYSTIFWEVGDELAARGAEADAVVIQVGVGALAAAAPRHYRRADAAHVPEMLAVEPTRAACVLASMKAGELVTVPGPHDSIMAGLNCGTPSIVAWPDVSTGYDLYMALGDDRARDAMRALADEGIVAGESGAAGVGALLEVLEGEGADDMRTQLGLESTANVLVLCTEGATDPDGYEAIVGRPPSSVARYT